MAAEDAYHLQRSAVRNAFGRAAETYDAAAVLQHEVLDRLLERVGEPSNPPAVILDAGAGTGRGARALSDRFRRSRVIALDIAEAMAARARRRKPWFRAMHSVCADAERLPFAAASVDLVFSNLMLQWLDTPEKAFAEFRRVLRPGGTLIFTTFGPDTLKELRAAWAAVDDAVHVNRFIDMHHLGDALLRTGFRDSVVDLEFMTVTYPDVHALMRDLKAIGAHNANSGRPQGLTGRRKLRAMQDAYEQERRDGVLPATWEVVYGFAVAPPAGTAQPTLDDSGEVRVDVASIGGRTRRSDGMRRDQVPAAPRSFSSHGPHKSRPYRSSNEAEPSNIAVAGDCAWERRNAPRMS